MPFDFDSQQEEILAWPKPVQDVFRFFRYSHLPGRLQEASAPFTELATQVIRRSKNDPETVTALRKLLEAKDAAVRAANELGDRHGRNRKQ